MNPLTHSKNATILPVLIALTLGSFGLSPQAGAVDPPPDGGYPGQNTAEGEDALLNLTTGESNTAIGFHALTKTRKASSNTAVGSNALQTLSSGKASSNTAVGANALQTLSSGNFNTALGFEALANATHADSNTAVGAYALRGTTTGYSNTAMGLYALGINTTGYRNTASGMNTLTNNTTGVDNTGYGYGSLLNVTTGSNNVALGSNAGWQLQSGSNNIDIGANGNPRDSNTIRIGEPETQQTTYVAGISGATVADGVTVVVGANGHLGTVTSSARYKEGVEPMDHSSEAILSLKPVRFRYKHELDPDSIPQFGLLAEQVEKVNPDLVARDDKGKPYTVRYEAVNAMLLNEFLKEHRKVEALEAAVSAQQKGFESQIAALTAALKAQAAQIQKVSDQLRAQAPAPRVVVND